MPPPLPKFPDIDVSRYHWTESAEESGLWQRQPLSAEGIQIHRPKELRRLFVGGVLTLNRPAKAGHLEIAAKRAWCRLRFEHPEIASQPAIHPKTDKLMIEYRVPGHEDDLRDWTERTIKVFFRDSELPGFVDALTEFRTRKEGSSREIDAAHVDLYTLLSTSDEELSTVRFMMHMDHLFADATGHRLAVRSFLRLLATELSNSSKTWLDLEQDINWANSPKNLATPWIYLMNDDQKIDGEEFDQNIKREFILWPIGSVSLP